MHPQLIMTRAELNHLPPVQVDPPYRLRAFHDGDQEIWTAIISESFAAPPEKYDFKAIMGDDPAFAPQRIWFVTCDEKPIATASAYIKASFMPNAGMLHYVGIRTAHAGHGLGYQVTLKALHQMVAEGWPQAWLSTDDFRLPALRVYFRCGFQPLLVHENQRQRWRDVLANLGPHVARCCDENLLDAPLYEPPSPDA